MARKIDFEKPLSADDLLYVRDRPWLKQDAELRGLTIQAEDDEFVVEDAEQSADPNLAMVEDYQTPEGAGADSTDEEELPDDYNEWTVEQLKAELKGRELAVSGSKEQLVERPTENDSEEDDE